ncbi:MAG TPA: hypothetical protein VGN63_15925 [Flavisolibacter sp.]|jgi:hypothetical protein|nr:hypothetical protein [Flavisolibacter sp.]
MILNIHHFNGQSLISHHHTYNPELVDVFRRFFIAAEKRNEAFKTVLQKLAAERDAKKREGLLSELAFQAEDTEVDIELVKKLLP